MRLCVDNAASPGDDSTQSCINMSQITLNRSDLDESLADLQEGDSVEICATIKVTKATPDEIVADVSDIAEDGVSEGGETEPEPDGDVAENGDESGGGDKPKGNLGILIAVTPGKRGSK